MRISKTNAQEHGDHGHAGIPCAVDNPDICAAIDTVLDSIRERAPRDLERVRARVVGFEALTPQECGYGTCGWFKHLPLRLIKHPVFGDVLEDDDQCQGIIALAPDADVVAVAAHELGHAATTEDDMIRRQAPDEEWASELAADYYAYKWGFGRAIAKQRPRRYIGHHAAGPGQRIGMTSAQGEHWWRISRRFVMHPCEAPDDDS